MSSLDRDNASQLNMDAAEAESVTASTECTNEKEANPSPGIQIETAELDGSSERRAIQSRTSKRKSNSKKQLPKIGTLMSAHQTQIRDKIVQQVDFFQLHTNLRDLDHMYYTDIPDTVDWGSSNSLVEAFPTIKGRGKMIVPMALIFESDHVDGKLIIINYWRLLKADEQRKVRDAVRSYYLRPSQGNERINLNVTTRTVSHDTEAVPSLEPPSTKIMAADPDGLEGILIKDHESFLQAVQNLSTRVRFFHEAAPLENMTKLKYASVPEDLDWSDSVALDRSFPQFLDHASRDVPVCLLLEAETNEERLVVVNWWRYLDSIQQPKAFQELRRYYRAPTKSKDPMRELQEVHDKRKERQNAPSWGFRGIATCQQLAQKLKLSCDMIQTANIEQDLICKSDGCIYPALCGNNGFCCLHRVSFAPLEGKERRKRGHFLIGSVYTKPNTRLCSCNSDFCVGIGFSENMIRFDVTRLPTELQAEIWDAVMPKSRKTACLAPWHFHPQHRLLQPDGSWIVTQNRRSTFKNPVTGSEWLGTPPPTYSVEGFLKEPDMVKYISQKKTTLLPAWVRQYQSVEEGPLSIPEQQTRQLYDKIASLEKDLREQAVDYKESYAALQDEMSSLQSKCSEKRAKKRGDGTAGKRRRLDGSENDRRNEMQIDSQQPEVYNDSASGRRNNADVSENMNPGTMIYANSNGDRSNVPTEGQDFEQQLAYPTYYHDRHRQSGGWHGPGSRNYY